MAREASVERNTKETEIKLKLTLDGTVQSTFPAGHIFHGMQSLLPKRSEICPLKW